MYRAKRPSPQIIPLRCLYLLFGIEVVVHPTLGGRYRVLPTCHTIYYLFHLLAAALMVETGAAVDRGPTSFGKTEPAWRK